MYGIVIDIDIQEAFSFSLISSPFFLSPLTKQWNVALLDDLLYAYLSSVLFCFLVPFCIFSYFFGTHPLLYDSLHIYWVFYLVSCDQSLDSKESQVLSNSREFENRK